MASTMAGILAACSKTHLNEIDSQNPFDADAIGTMEHLKTGQLKVIDLMNHTIEKAKALNPKINALVSTNFESALEAAEKKQIGQFASLPFAIKDLSPYKNTTTKFGSRAYKDYKGETYSPFIKAIDNLGIISIGKSATPEFGLTATTEPLLHAPCRNPWNLNHSTGGSSGGAAALVASGVLKIAHASDGGGSIRIPASCCGLVGFKTSRHRLIPNFTAKIDDRMNISVQGVLSRTVRDTAAFLSIMENPNHNLKPMGLVTKANEKRLKIAYCLESFNGSKIDAEVQETVLKTAKTLESLGHEIIPFMPKLDTTNIENAFMLLWSAGAAQDVEDYMKYSGKAPSLENFEPWTLWLAQNYSKNREKFPKALEILGQLNANFKSLLLPQFDALLTPVLASPAPEIGFLSPAINPELHYQRVVEYAPFFTAIMNASGAPAIALPMGMSKSGLPIGAQIAANIGDDKILLELAYELEAAAPWAQRKPEI